jgi:hypothetical protein
VDVSISAFHTAVEETRALAVTIEIELWMLTTALAAGIAEFEVGIFVPVFSFQWQAIDWQIVVDGGYRGRQQVMCLSAYETLAASETMWR